MKLKSILVSILVFQSLILPSYVINGEPVLEVQSLGDIMNYVEGIEIQFTSNEEIGYFGYTVTGTETIETKSTWVVETLFSDTSEEQTFTLWVDKDTGKTIQAEVEGEIISGMYAELYGNITLAFFMGFVYNFWQTWTYQDLVEWDSASYGEATSLGKQTQTIDGTTLETYGIRYNGFAFEDETINYEFEIWYAPTQFGGIMTYMSITATGQEDMEVELELTSIKLVEDQQIPNDFTGFTTETEPEPEPEPEPETETEPEEEEESTGGGIPGFPISSIIIALAASIFLTRKTKTIVPNDM